MNIKSILAALVLSLALALPAFASEPVDINTADAKTLAEGLNGIGMSKAEAIVAYRSENGPFKNAEELGNVKGIGEKTIERNRDMIVVSSSKAKVASVKTPQVDDAE
jgi:competence protein ComEA